MTKTADTMEKIVALCRRRGFIFGSSEIYGGIGGFWDYGPLGCELKKNIKDAWWNDMVHNPPPGPDGTPFQMVGVDCSIIMNPKVWEASGHVSGFNDPMRDCKGCKLRFRSDLLVRWSFIPVPSIPEGPTEIHHAFPPDVPPVATMVTDGTPGSNFDEVAAPAKRALGAKKFEWKFVSRAGGLSPGDTLPYCVADGKPYYAWDGFDTWDPSSDRCPNCGGELTEARDFNLMLLTHVGALQDASSVAYLRPETAQGIFANFKNVMDSTRVRIPFGIAQIGKAFRNEINPRNYTFRSREFEQMEIEFFCHPSEADKWYEYWRDLRYKWYTDLGLKSDKLRLRDHEKDELAHYARGCADVEYGFPFGVSELEGIANRTDFDLTAHQKTSGKDLTYFDDVRKERYIPYVIEPSAGVDRFTLAAICEAYSYDENRASPEFMKFHPRLAPIKAAVFPLVAKDGMPEVAEPIFQGIKKSFPCQYDAKQSIGKRYARMDEAGTPFCFTIDGQSKEDGTVTVRNRDDASQERIDKSRCGEYLRDKLGL